MSDLSVKSPTLSQRCRKGLSPMIARFRALKERYPWLEVVRKVLVTLIGLALIVGGIAISWLPGPGGFIAFFGIAILASEFRWVRRLTRRTESLAHHLYVRVTGSKPRWWYRAKRKMSANMAGEC